ncbi:hypothetical protein [Desulfonatronum sp. SC1]|uniref:hypothetical protein n=1 Tax=Desulfonatronum sp. SC1 TaxID=2109626 RepID=UPI001304C936|nr:hypothetical protein [Desulfonatronum sp. SC1]
MSLIFTVIVGCYAPREDRLQSNLGYADLNEQIAQEQRDFLESRERGLENLERRAGRPPLAMEPFVPVFNPLDEVPVSIAVQNETLHNILYVVARNAGLNLIIDPDIDLDHRITISFESTPSSIVIGRLLAAYDLSWEVEDNVLAVRRFQERVFNLGFLDTKAEYTLDAGGDIFGSAEGIAGMQGSFELRSQLTAATSIYEDILQNVADILEERSSTSDSASAGGESEGTAFPGHFTLDPNAGTLFVRTTPRKMRAVAGMISHLKTKMSRQVIIDAQLMEVTLSDGFQLGIDWNFVQHRLSGGEVWRYGLGIVPDPASQPDPGSGLATLSFSGGGRTLSATLNALETFGGVKSLSNPHIRTRHGHAALVVTGRSERYLRDITREVEGAGTTTPVTSYTTETATAFEGVMLGVVPYIDDDGVVDLSIFPIFSEIDLSKETPIGEDIRLTMPRVEVRNVSTNVRVRHDDMIILGGMIYKSSRKEDRQAPLVGSVPGLGWLFKNRADVEQTRELVVVMRIRVVE